MVASITLSPSTGVVGTTVTVTGAGWVASEALTAVTFDALQTARENISTLVPNASGAFVGKFVVPPDDVGAQTVSVTGATSGAKTAVFTMTPSITLFRNGNTINVYGQGYTAGAGGTITVFTVNGTTPAGETCVGAVPSAKGQWTGAFTLPATLGGVKVFQGMKTTVVAANAVVDTTSTTWYVPSMMTHTNVRAVTGDGTAYNYSSKVYVSDDTSYDDSNYALSTSSETHTGVYVVDENGFPMWTTWVD